MTASPRVLVRRGRQLARESLWFWPAVLGVGAVAAAELLVRLDRWLAENGVVLDAVFSGNADAARALLATIATATLTVLGVTLSITLAVLALSAQTYSPRVLRRFMRDRVVQIVIGVFAAAFAFSLVALRQVSEGEVPRITVTVATALAFVALALLILFFHHLASQIRAAEIVGAVADETAAAIPRHTRPRSGPPPSGPVPGLPAMAEVHAPAAGRVVVSDDAALEELARATGGTAVVLVAPGEFVARGEPVARLVGGRAPTEEERARLRGAIALGRERTLQQDLAFGLRQLVDVALRALSPALNDPTTAEEALLRAADLLRRLADREAGGAIEGEGRVLVWRPELRFAALVGLAFDQVRRVSEAGADTATMLVLLDGLGRILPATRDPDRVEAVRDQARLVLAAARRALPEPEDLRRVEAAAARLV